MKNETGRTIVAIVLALIFLAVGVVTNDKATEIRNSNDETATKILYIPLAGFEALIADVLWIRLIQYMGSSWTMDYDRGEWADDLYEKFDRLTRLDPHFMLAYHYGSLFLSVDRPEKALQLVDRGLEHIPARKMDWKLPFYGSFISYQYSREPDRFTRSLRYLEYTMQLEEYPSFVRRFHALVTEKHKSLKISLDLWYQLHKETPSMNRGIIKGHLSRVARKVLKTEPEPSLRHKAERILIELFGEVPIDEPVESGDAAEAL